MILTEKPYLKDDLLWIIRLLTMDIFNVGFVRIIILTIFLVHVLLMTLQVYFSLFILTLMDGLKYSPSLFGIFYAILCTFTFIYEGDVSSKVMRKFDLRAVSSGPKKIIQRIKIESLYISIFVLMNLLLASIAIVSFIVPINEDEDVFFSLYLFQKYLPTCATTLGYLFRSTFIILGFMMVNTAHQLLYFIEQGKFQAYLILNYAENLTNLENFNHMDDSALIKNYNYQQIVQKKIKLCIRRHVDLLDNVKFCVNILVKWIPLYSITGILFIAFSISFVFLFDGNLEERYFRIGMLALVSTTTFCAIFFLAQSVEDETYVFQMINTHIRWFSLNRSNLKLLFIMGVPGSKSITLRFTENLNVNYYLGVKIVKVIYSALCFLVQFNRINQQ